jgi:4-amino-4-deoxy-L-arabinose transferase-like glycosyltransferase
VRRALAVLRRVPAAGRWCAVVAFVNALVWMMVTPAFHVPDETAHVAYVQHLAETGDILDKQGADPFSPELHAFLDALRFPVVVGRPGERSTPSTYYDRGVDAVMGSPPSSAGQGGFIESSSQPPLYYALEAGVYLASPWKDLLHRLWLMRLVSALLAATTTLFAFMFLREVLREPWTWTVGALAVAVQPLFGFVSSGVHPDALMFTATAALLFTLARAFRRGLTPQLGLAIGLVLAVGLFAKLTFLTLIPGAVLGVALLAWRARAGRPAALRGAAAVFGVLATAVVLFVGLNTLVWDRPASGRVAETVTEATGELRPETSVTITRREQLSYTWQLYLPRLPFMNDQFDNYPLYQTFFKGTIGVFGWLDTPFPEWVYKLALFVVLPLVALCLAALWRRRRALRERWTELLAYATITAGLLLSIGLQGLPYRVNEGFAFEQARYLLPLIPLYGGALALAARGAGARLERPLGALIVVLAMAHGLSGQLLVISRFYG